MSGTPNQMPLPQKPKFRSLKTIAKSVNFMPYLIQGDPTDEFGQPLDLSTEAGLKAAIADTDNFFVLLAPLKYKSYLAYENQTGEALEGLVNRVLYVIAVALGMLKDENGEPVKLETNELDQIVTPFGIMYGTIEKNMTELASFILSQHGRIVGVQPDGTYVCNHVSKDEIIDELDPHAFTATGEYGESLFMEILEVSGVYVPEEVKQELEEAGELEQEAVPKAATASQKGKRSTKPLSAVEDDK